MQEREEKEKKPIERKSSIENEPKTLDFQQFQFAREAALHVINSKSTEEALLVFTEGLQPVSTSMVIRKLKGGEVWKQSDKDVTAAAAAARYDEEEEGDEDDKRERRVLPPRLPPSISNKDRGRDVVTAPF